MFAPALTAICIDVQADTPATTRPITAVQNLGAVTFAWIMRDLVISTAKESFGDDGAQRVSDALSKLAATHERDCDAVLIRSGEWFNLVFATAGDGPSLMCAWRAETWPPFIPESVR